MEVTHKVVFDQLPSISFLLLTEHLALNISMLGFLRELTLHTPRQTSSKIKCFWGINLARAFLQKNTFSHVKSRLALGSPVFLVGWLSPSRKWPKTQENAP